VAPKRPRAPEASSTLQAAMAGTSVGDLFHNKPKLPTSRKVFFEVDQVEAQVTGLVDEMKKDIEVDLAERNKWFQQQAQIKAEFLSAKQEVNAKARQQQKQQQQQSFLRGKRKDPTGEAKPPPPKRAAPDENAAVESGCGETQASQSKPAAAATPVAASPAMAASSTTAAVASIDSVGIGLAGYASDESEESSSGEETRPALTARPPLPISQAAAEAAAAAAEANAASAIAASASAGLAAKRAEVDSDAESQGSSAGGDDSVALDGTHLFADRTMMDEGANGLNSSRPGEGSALNALNAATAAFSAAAAGSSWDSVAGPAALRPEDMIATAPKRLAGPMRPMLARSTNGPLDAAKKLVQLRAAGPKVASTFSATTLAGGALASQLLLPPGVRHAKLCREGPPRPRAS